MDASRPAPRTRAVRLPLLPALLLLLSPGVARSDPAPRPEHLTHAEIGAEELAGWDALEAGKWIAARAIGDQLLGKQPGAFAGHFILGVALHRGEGDLARATFQLDLAMKSYERRFPIADAIAGKVGAETGPWRWHQSTLRELSTALGAMDRPGDQLEVIEKHNQLYAPPWQAHRIWPLMKLRRYDESRAAAREAIESDIAGQRKYARADLCGAESEAGDRQRAYEACSEATRDFREPGSGGQLEFANASDAALEVFRFDEAERFILEASRRDNSVLWVNPFQQAAELFITEGRIPEAIDSLRGGHELRIARPAWVDQFDRARFDAALAKLYLVAGLIDRAVAAAERSFHQPDRQGHASGTARQAESAAALVLSVALHDRAERASEQAVTATFAASIRLRLGALWDRLQSWRARRNAAVALSDEDFLVRSLRPYYLGIQLPPWLLPEVVDAIGGGVALAGLGKARAADRHPGVERYFQALEAEAQWDRGDLHAADGSAQLALANLPQAEVLLRARMEVIVAECARARGEASVAAAHHLRVMQHDPGLMRRLGLTLPVAIVSDDSPLGLEASRLVRRSPRFDQGSGLLRIDITGASSQPRACLLGPSREQIACATVNLPADVAPDVGARLLVTEIHQAVFALKADLTQADLTTLDGSTMAGRADRQVQSVLDKLGEPSP